MTDANVSNEVATATRTATREMSRRMMNFERQSRGVLTDAEKGVFALEVLAPLTVAVGAAGADATPLTQDSYALVWNSLSEAAQGWDRLSHALRQPSRILRAPIALARQQADTAWQAITEAAPDLLLAGSGALVIAALAGLWLAGKALGRG